MTTATEPKKGKLPRHKTVSAMDPVEMEIGFVRPEDITFNRGGMFYIFSDAPVTSKPNDTHKFHIRIQNVMPDKFVIEIPTHIPFQLNFEEMADFDFEERRFFISGISFIENDRNIPREIESDV